MSAARTPTTPHTRMERTPISFHGSGSRVKEEKIFVTVRVRPLSKREISVKDSLAWECADDYTIVYKSSSQDRTNLPSSYSFDKVFGPTCLTEKVYEEGAKGVALSALTGINATIFAYGQTSSGKTYTMRGITENAVCDIYKHIANTPEREFTIKISAMEIYNEVVRDLLKADSGPLRLLDDPEKGTIVEKLEEAIASDSQHLRHLIGICEAQRQVGETTLNDASSRSHQIIRLTVESCLRENSGCVKSFVANLNLVDLAGSERASQTHADGTRLKEGSHINRSLLTLTTVIRKLSAGKKGVHIPYRDSKLTRILQLSLGGNSRTAIICTMSPALSYVEQSRNTLLFASHAKEVTNSAHVNMIISDKQLVKRLQKEVARLEAELRTPEPSTPCSDALLLEKIKQLEGEAEELKREREKIKQLEGEAEELKRERDLAKSQLNELQKKIKEEKTGLKQAGAPPRRVKCLTFSGSSPTLGDKVLRTRNPMRQSSTVPLMLVHEIRTIEHLQEQLGEEARRAIEFLQKEVTCHKLGNQDAAETIARLQAEIREMRAVRSSMKELDMGGIINNQHACANLKEEITRLQSQGNTIANLEAQLENVQKSIDKLVQSLPNNIQNYETASKSSYRTPSKKKKLLPLVPSTGANIHNLIKTPCSPLSSSRKITEIEAENKAPEGNDMVSQGTPSCSEKATPSKSEDGGDVSSKDGTPGYRRSSSVNMKKMQKMFQNAAEENVRCIRDYVAELKGRVAKLQYQKQLLVCQVLELEQNEAEHNAMDESDVVLAGLQRSPVSWHSNFKEQMREIIELWDVCQVSIIHRTQFYLLFRGDPADQIYIEVEHRRLNWLERHFAEIGDESPAHVGDEPMVNLSSSTKALKQEREFLSKRLNSRLTEEERERLYVKWQVPLDAKQRKLQLVNKLWTDPSDKAHIEESADIVARLVGFCEGGNMIKEMFELNFTYPVSRKPWLFGWQPISNLLRK